MHAAQRSAHLVVTPLPLARTFTTAHRSLPLLRSAWLVPKLRSQFSHGLLHDLFRHIRQRPGGVVGRWGRRSRAGRAEKSCHRVYGSSCKIVCALPDTLLFLGFVMACNISLTAILFSLEVMNGYLLLARSSLICLLSSLSMNGVSPNGK